MNLDAQRVRATATARVGSGNQIKCMLPFAVIDRWADNYDPTPVTTYFPNDRADGNGRLVAERRLSAGPWRCLHWAVQRQHEPHGLEGLDRLRTTAGSEGRRSAVLQAGRTSSIFPGAPAPMTSEMTSRAAILSLSGSRRQPIRARRPMATRMPRRQDRGQPRGP